MLKVFTYSIILPNPTHNKNIVGISFALFDSEYKK